MNQAVTKAGFFPRLGAYLIDSIVVGTVLLCLRIPVAIMELCFPDCFIFGNLLFQFDIFDIIFYLLGLLYFVLLTSLTGTTIGKRLFNLTVVDSEGRNLTFLNALFRESVGKYLSNIFYFGYIMIFIDKDNRAFHDYLCDSAVVYTCRFRVIRKVVETKVVPAGADGSVAEVNAEPVKLYTESTATPRSTIVAEEKEATVNAEE